MNLTRCENGHFYDADRFSTCPHCSQPTISTVGIDTQGAKEYTVPLTDEGVTIPNSSTGGETIGVYDFKTEPVVGWVVAIAGEHFGEGFQLKTGRNFIGRNSSMDVALTGDQSISRDRHAIIVYDNKSNIFLVQPGDAKELFYLNNHVVLSAEQLHAYDILSLGKTQLLFVPLCSDKFNWDAIKPEG